jgi:uncharacterized protein (TIGR02996 family)
MLYCPDMSEHGSEGMTDGDALYGAIVDRREDDTPRLVYADWLDDHGHADRAAFIRIQIELARMTPAERMASPLIELEETLLQRHEEQWFTNAVPESLRRHFFQDGDHKPIFRRGFLDEVSLKDEAEDPANVVRELLETTLISGLNFEHNGRRRFFEHIAQLSQLEKLHHLGIINTYRESGMRVVAQCGRLFQSPFLRPSSFRLAVYAAEQEGEPTQIVSDMIRASWSKGLQSVHLSAHEGATVSRQDVQELVQSTLPQHLKDLKIEGRLNEVDRVFPLFEGATIWPQLQSLELCRTLNVPLQAVDDEDRDFLEPDATSPLIGSDPHPEHFPSLRCLSLENCHLSDEETASALEHFTRERLKSLSLRGNSLNVLDRLSSTASETYADLETLDVYNCRLPSDLSKLPKPSQLLRASCMQCGGQGNNKFLYVDRSRIPHEIDLSYFEGYFDEDLNRRISADISNLIMLNGLRTLTACHAALDPASFAEGAPTLEILNLRCAYLETSSVTDPGRVLPMIAGAPFPHLRAIDLRGYHSLPKEALEALIDSPYLPSLQSVLMEKEVRAAYPETCRRLSARLELNRRFPEKIVGATREDIAAQIDALLQR